MAIENLFVRTKKSIGGIQLDAVLTESHNSTVRTTKNPVEVGAEITDHSIIDPKKINIVAQVSDTPLGVAALGQLVDSVTNLFGTATSDNITRSSAAYNAMILLQEAREPIEVQTKLKLYTDMIITGISTTQDKDTSRIVSMSINLEEILLVESQVIKLNPEQLSDGSATEQASSAEKKGRQQTKEPAESTEKSVLKSVSDWIGG